MTLLKGHCLARLETRSAPALPIRMYYISDSLLGINGLLTH
jgi:hypothetical protein